LSTYLSENNPVSDASTTTQLVSIFLINQSNICIKEKGFATFLEYKATFSSWFQIFFATIFIMCSLKADPSILSSSSSSYILTSQIISSEIRVILSGVACTLFDGSNDCPLCAG
jgi:hypothetical protein